MGKGQKERYCPLWPETVALLKALLMRQSRGKQERIFVNRYGDPLGASGVRYKLRKLCDDSREANTSFKLQSTFHRTYSGTRRLVTSWIQESTSPGFRTCSDTPTWIRQAITLNPIWRQSVMRLKKWAGPSGQSRLGWKRDQDLLAWLETHSESQLPCMAPNNVEVNAAPVIPPILSLQRSNPPAGRVCSP